MLSIKVISYLVYLIWIFMSGSAHAVCVEGWWPYKDKCYHFSDDTKTHAEAIKACEDIGGILASVANKDVNDFLWNNKPFGPGEPFHWIGLVADTDWYWNDGSKADNVVVVNSEPDSVCATVTSDSVFSSTTCTDSKRYICVSSIMRTGWKEHNGMWYYISSEHLVDVVTNMVAMKNCWNMTTTLALIDNVSGLSLIVDASGYWIGLSKLHWLDDSPFHWHNWKHHEKGPIGGQPCMTLHPTNNKWDSQPCDGANRYICQRGLHITTTNTSTTTIVTTTVTTSTTNTTSTATTSTRKPTTSLKPVSTKQTPGTDGSAGNPITPTGQTATDITEGLTTAAGTKGEISARFGSIDDTSIPDETTKITTTSPIMLPMSSTSTIANVRNLLNLEIDKNHEIKTQFIGITVFLAILSIGLIVFLVILLGVLRRLRKRLIRQKTPGQQVYFYKVQNGTTNDVGTTTDGDLSTSVNHEMSGDIKSDRYSYIRADRNSEIPYEDIDNLDIVVQKNNEKSRADTYESLESSYTADADNARPAEYQSLSQY